MNEPTVEELKAEITRLGYQLNHRAIDIEVAEDELLEAREDVANAYRRGRRAGYKAGLDVVGK